MTKEARERKAALDAEVRAWLEVDDEVASKDAPYVNLRAMGFATLRDAQRWARDNEVPVVLVGRTLLARRADVERARAAPATARVFYTIEGARQEFDTRAEAAEAIRLAMGWKSIWLSHEVDVPVVAAFETAPANRVAGLANAAAEDVDLALLRLVGTRELADEDPGAPRIYRHVALVRGRRSTP